MSEWERTEPRLDLRLTGPALLAWAVTAATLSSGALARAATAGATVVAAVAVLAVAGRRGRDADGDSAGWLRALALALALTALTLLASACHETVRRAGPVAELAGERAVVRVEGVVLSDPRVLAPTGRGEPAVLLRLRVESVTGRAERAEVSTPVLVVGDERWGRLTWHDRVSATGRLAPVPAGEDVVARLRPTSAPRVLEAPGPVRRAADTMRAGLREAVAELPPDARGLLPGLVIGDTSLTPRDLGEAMRATGMTHLSAVSGSNVAIVLACVLGVARVLAVPRAARPWVGLLALAGFVVLARPDPSVVRAATMGAIGLLGLGRSRRGVGPPALAGAVVVLLVVDPWLSRSPGFALSVLATLGLLVLARPWGEAVGRVLPERLRAWGPTLVVPAAAQMVCAPVVVLLQGSVSLVAVPANLLAAPLVAPATLVGVAAALVAPLSAGLAATLVWLGAVPAEVIGRVARVFASVPGATAPWPDGGRGALLLAVVTLLLVLTAPWLARLARRHLVLALAVVLGAASVLVPTRVVTWPPEGWRLVACDVGQGDALVLATSPHHGVLVDAGPDPARVDRCLRGLGVDVLDVVVLTHDHADHVLGLPGALEGREVRQILLSPVEEPPEQAARVRGWAHERGIPVGVLRAGDRFTVGDVVADVWWPARRIDAGSVPNNASVVLAVRSGRLDALLLGDVEREAGHALLLALRRDPHLRDAVRRLDVVKAAHHGSSNLDESFVSEVAAPVALVSVGEGNDYGHPAARHLRLLRSAGATVYRTDRHGDVAVVEGPGGLRVETTRTP